jgi:hypothetical protein
MIISFIIYGMGAARTIDDAEIRGVLLEHFHGRRDTNS